MPKVSIIIPSRNEQFLRPTVVDLLAKARGDIEILAMLDGYWPAPPLPDDPRLRVLHRGQAAGMRPNINMACRVARGDYFLKIDAHCMVGDGYDLILAAECAPDWIVVPRRYPLDAEAWAIQDNGKPPVDAHYLSWPFAITSPDQPVPTDNPGIGLHGTKWPERSLARQHVLIDDEMSSQGSCWFMSRTHWQRLGEMDVANYGNFISEFQELGCKTWLGGGAVKVNKKTWYAHLHKGKKYGRGYFLNAREMDKGSKYSTRFWMTDSWTDRVRDMRWLIEHFWPVPGWPQDLDWAFRYAREQLA